MTSRKITVDNSVRNIPKIVETNEEDINPKTTKASPLSPKQNKKVSQNNKKWIASGF